MIGLPDYWYIACPALRLRERPLSARVLEHDIVVFRDADGRPSALADRCPHRGVPLSLGRREADGTLECRYHGWRFDGAGRCTKVPSLRAGQVPQPAEVPSFACAERDGYIWVWIGRRAPAGVPGIADFATRRWVQSSWPQEFAWTLGIENNLDLAHAGFAHPWTHPAWYLRRLFGSRETETELRLEDHGLLEFIPATSGPDAPLPERPTFMSRFELPDRVRVDFWMGPLAFTVLMHFVPTGEHSCRLELCVSNPFYGLRRVKLTRREPGVPRQDRILMESVRQPMGATRPEYSVPADAPTLLARRIIELASNGLWEEKRESLPRRKIVSARI